MNVVYLLLPPSETKHPGGSGPALDVDGLPFTELHPSRKTMVAALTALSAHPESARKALKISEAMSAEVEANRTLASAPTSPALRRYTGVLYGALDAPTLSRAEWSRAKDRILITSALFGLLTAESAVPAYRLSANSTLPGLPGVSAFWRSVLPTALATLDRPVMDLRSGAYAAFGSIPGFITVRVVATGPDGVVRAISHDNKATKGRFARLLATSRAELADLPSVLRVSHRAGWTVKRTGPQSLDVFA